MIDINDIEKQVQEALKQKIEAELVNYDFYSIIENQILLHVQDKVNATVTQLLTRLIDVTNIQKTVDLKLSQDIQEKIDLAVKSRVAQTVSQRDIGTEISNRIADFVQERMQQASLPNSFIPAASINWSDHKLSANCIGSGTIEDFSSTGIEDSATEVNLTILDNQVVVENELLTNHLTVLRSARVTDLKVDNLTVDKKIIINDPQFAAQIKSLVDNRISQHSIDNDFDLNGKPLMSNNVKLIDNKSLGNSIVESNLRKLGRLSNLNVIGETNLAETVYIDNGRVGINTDEPAGVFTAWDEESEITIRKHKNRTMYIGSTRDSELVLGTGGNVSLAIRKDGIETNQIKIGNINITSGNKEPNYRGAPGDLVINYNSGSKEPWAWRCTGGETWIPLK